MTSTAESGHLLRVRDNHRLVFDRAVPIRVTSSTVSPGASWNGITNIWQTTPRAFQNDKGIVGQSSSLYRNDSSTRLTSLDVTNRAILQEYNTASGGSGHSRISPTFSNDPTLSAHRFIGPSLSPVRARAGGRSNVDSGTSMSVLSNAALLNGSAPDVEPSSNKTGYQTQHSLEGMEDKLRTLNLARVHEFVPSQPQEHERQQRQDKTNGGTMSHVVPALQPSPRTGVNGPGGSFSASGPRMEHFSLAEYNEIKDSYQSDSKQSRAYGLTTPPQDVNNDFGGHRPLNFDLVPPYLNKSSNLLNTNAGRDSPYTRPSYPRRVDTWNIAQNGTDMYRNNNSAMCMPGPSLGVDAQSIANANRLAYLNNSMADAGNIQDTRYGIQARSLTPAATESQRSNSGSGQSTQASNQAIESRSKPFESGHTIYQNRLPAYQNQIQPSPYQFYPGNQTAFPYNDAYVANHMVGMRDIGIRGGLDDQQDPDKPISPFLREFKVSCKTKRYELKDVYGYIVEFSGDQHGSRFIQGKLETANSDEKEQVFTEIQENSLQLMTDIFGNYVIQKLFEHGTQAQKKVLANQMRGRVLYLTTQVYGCRVVQKALEHVLTDQQASMVKELEGHVLPIVENQNGNHVIQKAIERVPGEQIQFIVEAHKGQVVRLSKHNYGCRVVQRMLEHGSSSVKRAILGEIYDSIPSLIVDQFGNYVMQHVIRNGDPADKFRIVSLVQQQLLFFSKHKFASNVVEAAIESAEEGQRRNILDELTKPDKNGHSQVYDLIRDQYGNYVIQKVLQRLQGAARDSLVHEIKHHLVDLRRVSHGKQVSAMEKALAEASFTLNPDGYGQGSYMVGRNINARPFIPQPFQPRYSPFG